MISVSMTVQYDSGIELVRSFHAPGLHELPSERPSASAEIVVIHSEWHSAPDDGHRIVLATQRFDGATEDEVKAKVEAWVQGQFLRMISALRKEFGV